MENDEIVFGHRRPQPEGAAQTHGSEGTGGWFEYGASDAYEVNQIFLTDFHVDAAEAVVASGGEAEHLGVGRVGLRLVNCGGVDGVGDVRVDVDLVRPGSFMRRE